MSQNEQTYFKKRFLKVCLTILGHYALKGYMRVGSVTTTTLVLKIDKTRTKRYFVRLRCTV